MRKFSRFLPAIAALLLWELLGRLGLVSRFVLPWPSLLVEAFWELLASGGIFADMGWSLLRVGGGFLLAMVLGTAVGFAIGLNRGVARMFEPILDFLRPIPPVAWVPLAVVWFGLGNGPAFFLTFIAGFFPIVVSSASGVNRIAKQHFQVAQCLQASRMLFFKRVLWPGALPHVLSGYRIGFSVSWMAVVAAEMIAAKSGLGHLIFVSQDVLRTDFVLVGIILIGLIGVFFDAVFRWTMRRLTPWESV